MAQACETPLGVLRIAPRDFPDPADDPAAPAPADTERPSDAVAVLGGGCFWCVEAVFKAVDGVLDAVSGYAGGTADTATYQAVCSGRTGHAEVVKVRFDARRISFGQILKLFFSVAHDPTQLNRQGNDRGPQYRSVIFTLDDTQRRIATNYIKQLEDAAIFARPIVTTLEPLEAFHAAEDYHQDYAARNPHQPYISFISRPKVDKLQQQFPERLKR